MTKKEKNILIAAWTYLVGILVFFWNCNGISESSGVRKQFRLVNFAHLNHLYEEIDFQGKHVAIIHIYSEYPEYGWVEARGEGIACVDDAARAAVVYLRHFELSGDTLSLRRSRMLLQFIRAMQDQDGLFYNFIFADHSINRQGRTSYKSLGWWTARGIWALGKGLQVFQKVDRSYAKQLQMDIKRIFVHLDTLLEHYPQIDNINGFKIPRWLLYNSAADATSELMLGLVSYFKVTGSQKVKKYLQRFAEGLRIMQLGKGGQFPYGLFLSWKNIWHGWGNSQIMALTLTGHWLHDAEILSSAQQEAGYFYPYWQRLSFPREIQFSQNDSLRISQIKKFDQIAYAMRPPIVGSLRLYEITHRKKYAQLAGELATWFFGNNVAHKPMYNPATGRCYDGILSKDKINLNSGAESTIEALYAIMEVEANQIAREQINQYIKLKFKKEE